MASPTHTNIGDHMISLGTKKWCQDFLPGYKYKEFDDDIYKDWSFFDLVRLCVKKEDFVLLRGGGSIGDRYLGYELFIRHALKVLDKNKVFMFPQSIFFSSGELGQTQRALTAAAYDRHPDFTLCLRDQASYNLALQMFKKTKLHLCPDMALYLKDSYRPKKENERRGSFLCLRQDGEKHHKNLAKILPQKLTSLSYQISLGDTAADSRVSHAQRPAVVEDFLLNLSKKEAIVTDRYHGLIAAALTLTPVVVLQSEGHKIPSGLKWFEGGNFIFFADSPDRVPALLKKALACEERIPPDFSPHFVRLREVFFDG